MKPKKEVIMQETTKSRIVFTIRLISWILIGCVLPISVFAYKFGLFREYTLVVDELGNVVSKTNPSLNGWGIISCLLVGSFISAIVKDISDAYVGYSLAKQCYKGICSTMPLIIAFAVCYFLKGVLDQVMFCLIILILCKLVSTPINPLPKWKYEKRGSEDYSTLFEAFTAFIRNHRLGGDV